MGKKRLAEVRSKEVNNHKTVKQKIDDLLEAVRDIKEDTKDKAVMKVRVDFADNRWKPYCGVTRYEDIDWSIPQISLEWKLCDPRVLKDLLKPGGRERLFAICSEEEKYVYLNEVGTDGAKYTDLETEKSGFTKKNIAKAVVRYRNRR